MKVENLTASNIVLGSLVLRGFKTRSIPPAEFRKPDVALLISQLESFEKIRTEEEEGDDDQPVQAVQDKSKDDSIIRPRGSYPRPIPGSITKMSREELAVAKIGAILELGSMLGIPKERLEGLGVEESRLYVGALAFKDPGLYREASHSERRV